MIAAQILLASGAVLAGWIAYRRVHVLPRGWLGTRSQAAANSQWHSKQANSASAAGVLSGTASPSGTGAPSGTGSPNGAGSLGGADPASKDTQIGSVNAAVSQRLWRLAFGAPAPGQILGAPHLRVRELICAKLQVDALDPDYFPRRPTLMPQLMKALDDPRAESEKLSRIIAHDPVLTGDVLRLANSSIYRTSSTPIESIQRALVVCGVDALRGILATAMLRPVFRATRTNFPRLPRILWERTQRAARAAELYAMETNPQDRFESQLIVLLNALGPLVVYGAALNAYSRVPSLSPDPALFIELIGTWAPVMSRRMARDWETSPRLRAALEKSPQENLTIALTIGELLGSLSYLESQTVISGEERLNLLKSAGLPDVLVATIWGGMMTNP